MKKIWLFVLILCLCAGCSVVKEEEIDGYPEASQFIVEYQYYNGMYDSERGHSYLDVEIENAQPIHYATYEEVMEVLDGTGVIYLGFPECPWCRNAIGVLLEACEEVGIDRVYYLNNRDDRNELSLQDDGTIVTEKEGTEEYLQLLDKLGESADVYDGLNDPSIRRIYYPTVIGVKNGKVVFYHTSTVESQTDPYVGLTDEQREELMEIYTAGLKKVKVSGCSVETKC